jgi:murein DD-endopeptidase MepM/ murein hydrolase activator NlpD
MSLSRYRFNKDKLVFEEIRYPFYKKLYSLLPFIFAVVFFSLLFLYLLDNKVVSPKEKILLNDQLETRLKLDMLDAEIQRAHNILDDIEYNDDHIYRTYFEVGPLSPSLRAAGYGGNVEKSIFRESQFSRQLDRINHELNVIAKKLVIQSKSYDEVIEMAVTKEKRLAARPAIQPVSINDLIRFGSRFGMRDHPILKVRKMHEGIDLTARRGTNIYATADGIVIQAGYTTGGYGNKIVIDHGFGYRTLYGHCADLRVKKGQKVKRGDVIGTVGSTGLSVSPHLHYEVHINGRKVNPINYYTNDLSASEFDRMIRLLSEADPGFDIN